MRPLRFLSATGFLLAAWTGVSYALFAVSPGSTQLIGRQGETKEAALLIENQSDQEATVAVDAENWHVRLMGYHGELGDVFDWIVLEPKEFTMPPKSQGDYTFKVRIPGNLEDEAMAQVYFAFKGVGSGESSTGTNPTMNIEQRIGVLVSIAARETASLKAAVTDMDIRPYYKEDGSLDLNIRMSMVNRGNIHARPEGKVKILKGAEEIAETKLGLVRSMFKGNSESYRLNFENINLAPGAYTAKALIGVKSFDLWQNVEYVQDFTVEEKSGVKSSDKKKDA